MMPGDKKRAEDRGHPSDDRVEELLKELRPVDLPPFYRTRLLAKVRGAGTRPAWRERLGAPRLAWSVAAVCIVALVIVALRSTRTTPDGQPAPVVQVASSEMTASVIDPVTPVDNSVIGAGDVEIVAAIHPPIKGGMIRLYVDERDVTGLAEVTESYVMYSPGERFEEGEHIVTIEIRDGSGLKLKDLSWLFYTLDGKKAELDQRI